MLKLTIELVPSTAWYSNVRSNVSPPEWDKIRWKCYRLAGNRCEVCGDVGTNQGARHKVECHEIWLYDDEQHTQTLVGFISLCPRCHKSKHIGLAQIKGEEELVIKHMMKVNNLSRKEVENLIDEAFRQYRKRSSHEWELDISYIKTYTKEH